MAFYCRYNFNFYVYKPVNGKAVPLHAGQAQRRARGIVLPILDPGARGGWVVSATPRPFYRRERDAVLVVQEAGWASGPVWIGRENLAPAGFEPGTFQPVASRYTDYVIPVPYKPVLQYK
jgi:hypothetical protein